MTKNNSTSDMFPTTSFTDPKTVRTRRDPIPNSNEYIQTVGHLEKILLSENNTNLHDYLYDMLGCCLTPEEEMSFE